MMRSIYPYSIVITRSSKHASMHDSLQMIVEDCERSLNCKQEGLSELRQTLSFTELRVGGSLAQRDFCTQACILFGFFTRLASLITLWYPLFHTLVSCLPHSTLWYPLFHTLVSYLFNFGILSSTLWYPPAGIAFWLLHAGFAFFFGFFTQAASLFGCVTRRHRFFAFARRLASFLAFSRGLHLWSHFGIPSSTLWYPLFHTLVSSLPHFGIPSSTLWYPLFHTLVSPLPHFGLFNLVSSLPRHEWRCSSRSKTGIP